MFGDFLSNITSNIAAGAKDIAGRLGSGISNIAQKASSLLPASIQGSLSRTNVGKSLGVENPLDTIQRPSSPQQTINETISTPLSPTGKAGVGPDGRLYFTAPGTSTQVPVSSIGEGIQGTVNPTISEVRPAITVNAPTPSPITGIEGLPQFQQAQIQATPGASFNPQTGQITSPTGLSGLPGQSSQQQQIFGLGAGGDVSTPGVSGIGTSFGGIGGVGNIIGSSPILTTQDEEEQRRRFGTGGQTTPQVGAPGASLPNFFEFLGGLVPSRTYTFDELKALQTASPRGEIDAGQLESTQTSIESILTSPEALSEDDRAEVFGSIDQTVAQRYEVNSRENPIPPNPVVETPEQVAYIEGLPEREKFEARKAMDNLRVSTGLTELETTRLDLLKQVQSANEAYQAIYDDIKTNPNLPKGLAKRRLAEIAQQQKTRMTQLTNQLQIVGQQISDANEVLNREFNILTLEENQRERERDNNRQLLNIMINSGGIGAFTNQDIAEWSQATGVPTHVLAKLKNFAVQPDIKISGSVSDGFSVIRTDKNGNVSVKQVSGGTSGGASSNYSQQQRRVLDASGVSSLGEQAANWFLATDPDFQDIVIRAISVSGQTPSFQALLDAYQQYLFEEGEGGASF